MNETEWEEEVRGYRGRLQRSASIRPPNVGGIGKRIDRPMFSPRRIVRRPIGRSLIFTGKPFIAPSDIPSEYGRWVQSSLNAVLGLNLPVTGYIDAQTRRATQQFQQREGLPVDGIAGPETRDALVRARAQGAPATSTLQPTTEPTPSTINDQAGELFEGLDSLETEWEGESPPPSSSSKIRPPQKPPCTCPTLPTTIVIDDYEQGVSSLGPAQQPSLSQAYKTLLCSLSPHCTAPREIRIIGHASAEGSPSVNRQIGRKRAIAVMKWLNDGLGAITAARQVLGRTNPTFAISSRGETQPLVKTERGEADRKRNRRVEVRLIP